MTPTKIHDTLATLRADEVADALRLVDALELSGRKTHDEADEWRRAILARPRFLKLGEAP